jgi:hypothetical protein
VCSTTIVSTLHDERQWLHDKRQWLHDKRQWLHDKRQLLHDHDQAERAGATFALRQNTFSGSYVAFTRRRRS